jgi:DNA-directed RNA polymerase subunit RPC12/RpoP
MPLEVYKCETCGTEFNDSDILMRHNIVHAGPTVTTTTVQTTPLDVYKCETCGAAFNSSDTLMTHKIVHARPAMTTTFVKTTTVKED